MSIARRVNAFTLIELLVGLQITGILLTAVATMAFAMSVAAREADDTTLTQTTLRYTVLRVGELIRTSRLVCAAPGTDVVLWQADDYRRGQIDVNEIVYIEYDDPTDTLRLLEFDPPSSLTILAALGLAPGDPVLTALAQPGTKAALVQAYTPLGRVRRTTVLQGCRNLVFTTDQAPPHTRSLALSFDLAETDGVHHYEIRGTLRPSAQHFLSPDGSTLVSDDD